MENVTVNMCPRCQKPHDARYNFCPGCGQRSGEQAEAKPCVLPAYGWIWEEPGAFIRFYRIGLGLAGWGMLMMLSLIPIVSIMASTIGPMLFDSEHEHSINWLLIVIGGVVILILQILVFAICLGGILRLLRDVARDALHLSEFAPSAGQRNESRIVALVGGAALLLVVVTALVVPRTSPPVTNSAAGAPVQKPPGDVSDDNVSKVRKGMTELEVERLLGPPGLQVGDTWTWTGEFGTFDVRFRDKKVIESNLKPPN